ncbi:HAD family hydrolase [Trinickia acidisoli]|uniref:HAD family hydrolase n=1 Tax=Trinickia acidisoli TaxID=2767482 RepID=UPI001F5C538B|nr:HAD family phosphatase [Trinickia acidisoli]
MMESAHELSFSNASNRPRINQEAGIDAVLFDCDGVLVDSENITKRVLRQMLAEQGWALSDEECMTFFVGKAPEDEATLIEAHTGKPLTTEWLQDYRSRRNTALEREVQAVTHVGDVVHTAFEKCGGRIACASGSDRTKIELQLRKVKLMPYFEGRIFCGPEMPRTKPEPDVYLAAAQALGVATSRCAVLEDSVTGVTAGKRAGATVLAYCAPQNSANRSALLEAGADMVFTDMTAVTRFLLQV